MIIPSRYATFSDEALVKLLFTEEDRLPRMAVDEFLDRGERLVSPLTELIEDPQNWTASPPAWWAPIHATFILGVIGGISVIPGLLKAMELAETNECDWVSHVIPAIFGSLGPTSRPGLTDIVTNRSHSPFLRGYAVEALAATTLSEPEADEEVFSLLGAIFADASEEKILRGIIGNVLLDFQRSEYIEHLLAFTRQDTRTEEGDVGENLPFSEDDIEEAFTQHKPTLRLYQQDWLTFYDPDAISQRQARWAQEEEEVADEEALWEGIPHPTPSDPVNAVSHVAPKIGRNDPCPCGSGKKYKKCCLNRGETSVRQNSTLYTEADRTEVLSKLRTFANRPGLAHDRDIAFLEYWGTDFPSRSEKELQRVLELPQAEAMYNSWLWFDFTLDEGLTITDLFLAKEGRSLRSGEQAYLDQARSTYQGLYEVEEVRLDEGFTLRNLTTDERLWVRERLGTHGIVRWDFIAARLMPRPDTTWVMETGLFQYPPRVAETMLPQWEKAQREFHSSSPQRSRLSLLKGLGPLLTHWWISLVVFPPMPTLVTAEGDLLVFTKVVFDVHDREDLLTALAGTSDVEETEPGVFDWYECTSTFRRSLGTIRVSENRLILETTSEARAERGRQLLETASPQCLSYRITSTEELKLPLEKDSGKARTRPPSPEIDPTVMKQFYDTHYRAWVNEPVPALDGLTPRQATSNPKQRSRLIMLLKDMENHEAHAASQGRPAYDPTWLWNELGLTRDT